jgi:hypothetical protein
MGLPTHDLYVPRVGRPVPLPYQADLDSGESDQTAKKARAEACALCEMGKRDRQNKRRRNAAMAKNAIPSKAIVLPPSGMW